MKNTLKTYKVIYPLSARIMIPVIMLLLIVLHYWLGHIYGEISLGLISADLMLLDLLCDFFIFNGVSSPGTNYGILRYSPAGKALLQRGILLDQLRRLLEIVLVTAVVAALTRGSTAVSSPSGYLWYTLLNIAVIYTGSTLILTLVRYISSLMPYVLVSSLLTMIPAGLLFLLYTKGWLYSTWAFPLLTVLFAAAGVFATRFMLKLVLRNYDHSFLR